MASYVIHDIAGEVFLATLSEKLNINLSEEERNHFLMGNLIPDSSKLQFPPIDPNASKEELKKIKWERSAAIQQEKQSTHFRVSTDLDKNIQSPQLELFLSKYRSLLSKDISVLGYLFHLYTDKVFFKDLFNKSFTFLNGDKQETDIISETKSIVLKRNNQEHDVFSVFSKDSEVSIYHDYTKMNTLLLTKYNIEFPYASLMGSTASFVNPGIEEVSYENITGVLNKTSRFIEESKQLQDSTLKVFDQHEVENFISDVVSSFIDTYLPEILSYTGNNEEVYKYKKTPVSQ